MRCGKLVAMKKEIQESRSFCGLSLHTCLLFLLANNLLCPPIYAQSEQTYVERHTESSSTDMGKALGRPKYKERIDGLGDQIKLVQSKGFITQAEAEQFLARQSKLLSMEEQASKSGFSVKESDEIEKEITLLNSDLFKASHKDSPVKSDPSDADVNDPNLIPAYPDKELQPGSGKVEIQKSSGTARGIESGEKGNPTEPKASKSQGANASTTKDSNALQDNAASGSDAFMDVGNK